MLSKLKTKLFNREVSVTHLKAKFEIENLLNAGIYDFIGNRFDSDLHTGRKNGEIREIPGYDDATVGFEINTFSIAAAIDTVCYIFDTTSHNNIYFNCIIDNISHSSAAFQIQMIERDIAKLERGEQLPDSDD